IANFFTEGKMITHSALLIRSEGMLSGMSRISFSTTPASCSRSSSLEFFSLALKVVSDKVVSTSIEAVRFKAVMLPFHINLKIAATSFLRDELSARPGQHQSHVIGLFGAPRPIQHGGDDALGELGKRQAAVFAQKFQQTRLAKFAKLIFRLSDAVAISHQQIAGAKLDGAFVVADLLEETDHGSAGVELAESAVFANEQWRQMAGVAVSERARGAIINSEKQRGILFRGRGVEQMPV